MLSEYPRFNAAKRYSLPLLLFGLTYALVGFGLLNGAAARAKLPGFPKIEFPSALGYVGAALWLAAAAFISGAFISYARQRLLGAEAIGKNLNGSRTDRPSRKHSTKKWNLASRLIWPFEPFMEDATWVAGWPQTLLPMIFGGYAFFKMVALWNLPAQNEIDPITLKLSGAALVMAAFPLLVHQRIYANFSADILPEAPALERLLRLPLTACVGLAIALFLMSVGIHWASYLEQFVALIIFIVALEQILRSAATLFIPFAPIEQRKAVTDSVVAGFLLRLRPPNFSTINITVRRQFGIDLSRSWALAFIQRAALPIFVGIGIFAWLVTGMTALAINERGVYERLGIPVAVLQPGLHLHLPWPIGVVRVVETGVVHQLPIEFLLPGATAEVEAEEKQEAEEKVAAEGPAPESADRLWDDAHPFEGNYLIASEENSQQSFQLSDVDMAVIYQVGLSDEAARDAAYRVADPDGLIQALSGQLLVHYLSHNTLLNLLGQSRESFSKDFQTGLQQQLDQLSSGIEVLAISIEAIHPPPGAASAYHNVQAAEIRSNTQISISRGEAIQSMTSAQTEATNDRNQALAMGAETVGQAQAASVVFGGDKEAYADNKNAFLLERWFDDLTQALGKSEYIVIDHRLNGVDVPTLDLRKLGTLSTDADVPNSTESTTRSYVTPDSRPAPSDDDAD